MSTKKSEPSKDVPKETRTFSPKSDMTAYELMIINSKFGTVIPGDPYSGSNETWDYLYRNGGYRHFQGQ